MRLSVSNFTVTDHCSDEPLLSPTEVDYFPTSADIELMTRWKEVAAGRMLTKNVPILKSCKKFIR